MHLRLCEIYDDICTLVDTFHPDEVSIEELFFSKNITTGIQVAQARGVILLALGAEGAASGLLHAESGQDGGRRLRQTPRKSR